MIDKRIKKNQIAILKPKTELGKSKISYHQKWHIIGIETPKFVRSKGECYICRSVDGSKILYVQLCNDPDIEICKL